MSSFAKNKKDRHNHQIINSSHFKPSKNKVYISSYETHPLSLIDEKNEKYTDNFIFYFF